MHIVLSLKPGQGPEWRHAGSAVDGQCQFLQNSPATEGTAGAACVAHAHARVRNMRLSCAHRFVRHRREQQSASCPAHQQMCDASLRQLLLGDDNDKRASVHDAEALVNSRGDA